MMHIIEIEKSHVLENFLFVAIVKSSLGRRHIAVVAVQSVTSQVHNIIES